MNAVPQIPVTAPQRDRGGTLLCTGAIRWPDTPGDSARELRAGCARTGRATACCRRAVRANECHNPVSGLPAPVRIPCRLTSGNCQPRSPAAPELVSPPFCSCRRLETWPHRALLECARGAGRPVRRWVPGKRRLRGQPPRLAFSHDGWLAGGETSLVRTRPVRSWLGWLLMAVRTAAGRRPRCRPVVPADRRARGAGRRGPTRRAAPSRRSR